MTKSNFRVLSVDYRIDNPLYKVDIFTNNENKSLSAHTLLDLLVFVVEIVV